jgi:hypothetical protein
VLKKTPKKLKTSPNLQERLKNSLTLSIYVKEEIEQQVLNQLKDH